MNPSLVLALLTAVPASPPFDTPATLSTRPARATSAGWTPAWKSGDAGTEAIEPGEDGATRFATGHVAVGPTGPVGIDAETLPARGIEGVARDRKGQEDPEDADGAKDPGDDRSQEGEVVGGPSDRGSGILSQLRASPPYFVGGLAGLGFLLPVCGIFLPVLFPRRRQPLAFVLGSITSFTGIALLALCYKASI